MNLPHTQGEIRDMLSFLGLSSVDELFSDIPDSVRLKNDLKIPQALSEGELRKKFISLTRKNISLDYQVSFLGAGVYRHEIPAAINALISRGEFATAYTPYQAEASQGTLQAIYEYQTLMCKITGMDVANASHYDGASSLAEAALMAMDITQKECVAASRAVHPHYRQVVKTYLDGRNVELKEVPMEDGATSLKGALDLLSSGKVSALLVGYPNFFGVIEPLAELSSLCQKHGALLVVSVVDPLALGILKPPGELGAAIVAGEGQGMGIPTSFGGPHVGYIAVKKEHMRRIPGRLVGETTDMQGRRAFTLTLQAREQHIRREKAPSNVCTNQSLLAVANAIYLSLLGKQGFREASLQCWHKAHHAFREWKKSGLFEPLFKSPFYHEFGMKLPVPAAEFARAMEEQRILPGYLLEKDYPEFSDCLLMNLTEVNTKEEIELLLRKAQDFAAANSAPHSARKGRSSSADAGSANARQENSPPEVRVSAHG